MLFLARAFPNYKYTLAHQHAHFSLKEFSYKCVQPILHGFLISHHPDVLLILSLLQLRVQAV